MIYNNVSNCRYVSADKLYIGCTVDFEKLGSVYFVASATDSEEHGREIYQKARRGDFGPVVDYVSLEVDLTIEQRKDQERAKRNQLLLQLDSLVSNPLRWNSLSEIEQNELADYRLALLEVPQQAEFPENIQWPEPPALISNNTRSVTATICL